MRAYYTLVVGVMVTTGASALEYRALAVNTTKCLCTWISLKVKRLDDERNAAPVIRAALQTSSSSRLVDQPFGIESCTLPIPPEDVKDVSSSTSVLDPEERVERRRCSCNWSSCL